MRGGILKETHHLPHPSTPKEEVFTPYLLQSVLLMVKGRGDEAEEFDDMINPEGNDDEIKDLPDIDEVEEQMDEVDLVGEDMYRDYGEDPDKDRYDTDELDDREHRELTLAERRRIDAQLNERDRLLRSGVYLEEEGEEGKDFDQLDEMGLPIQRRRRRRQYEELEHSDEDLLSDIDVDPLREELTLESLSNVKAASYSEWITQPNVSRTIARELKLFLLQYTDETGRSVYGARIRTLGELNSESLEVSYRHLAESKAILALFLAKCPEEMLKIFDMVAMEATELHYPDYARIHPEIHVRISDFPTIYNLRELRESNLSSLVRVTGVVTRRTGVFPQLKYVKFNCLKCGTILGPYFQDSNAGNSYIFLHQL